MKLTELLIADLDREMPITRRALEAVPDKPDWKPHDKSMPMGRLAALAGTPDDHLLKPWRLKAVAGWSLRAHACR
jgi:hypothetical protein